MIFNRTEGRELDDELITYQTLANYLHLPSALTASDAVLGSAQTLNLRIKLLNRNLKTLNRIATLYAFSSNFVLWPLTSSLTLEQHF